MIIFANWECPYCKYVQTVQKYPWNENDSWFCISCTNGTQFDQIGPPKPTVKVTTQKAKGIYALAYKNWGVQVAHPIACFPVKDEIPETVKLTGPLFARPCPPSPEHGFVESRTVKTLAELESLRIETAAVNLESEILLMDRIDAVLNAIWTPSLLSIGPGHDGATAGKDTISLPLAGINGIPAAVLVAAGITKSPYVEAVYDAARTCWLTQIRNGPALDAVSEDFIPQAITVQTVRATAGEDLLEWAKVVKLLAPGTVVWHPGGCLTDHYTVHCREAGVPIMLSRQPLVGEMLLPKPLEPPDATSMQLGVIAGSLVKLNPGGNGSGSAQSLDYQLATQLLLICLHNSAALRGTYSYWLGVAVSLMIRLGTAALRGG